MIFVGDVHGKWKKLNQVLRGLDDKEIIQVGDLGMGFPLNYGDMDPEDFGDNFKFIRGNHDNPAVCKNHKNYLGDFGVLRDKIMYLSGAWSIDHWHRFPGLTWWPDEELSIQEFTEFLDLYSDIKPELMITHDCPISLYPNLGIKNPLPNRTAQALNSAFRTIHQPKYWVFGHHHKSISFKESGTTFYCVDELDTLELEV